MSQPRDSGDLLACHLPIAGHLTCHLPATSIASRVRSLERNGMACQMFYLIAVIGNPSDCRHDDLPRLPAASLVSRLVTFLASPFLASLLAWQPSLVSSLRSCQPPPRIHWLERSCQLLKLERTDGPTPDLKAIPLVSRTRCSCSPKCMRACGIRSQHYLAMARQAFQPPLSPGPLVGHACAHI